MTVSRRLAACLLTGVAVALSACMPQPRLAGDAARSAHEAQRQAGVPTPDQIMIILSERGDAM